MSQLKKVGRGPVAMTIAALVALAMVLLAPNTAGAEGKGGGSPWVAKSDAGKMKSRVTGTTDDGRKVAGTFTPSSFEVVGDEIMANGTLDLIIRGKGAPQRTSTDASLPVTGMSVPGGGSLGAGAAGMPAAAAGSCDILHLVLGPLDLDLLGLQIHLDQVVLDIVAQSGAGNLLGNLLCAVAGLLDPAGPIQGLLTQLVGLLQQILGALNLGGV